MIRHHRREPRMALRARYRIRTLLPEAKPAGESHRFAAFRQVTQKTIFFLTTIF